MGKELIEVANKRGFEIAAGIDSQIAGASFDFPVYESIRQCEQEADVLIDFSRPQRHSQPDGVTAAGKSFPRYRNTGFSRRMAIYAQCAEEIPIFKSANMSLGVNLQMELAKITAAFFGERFDIEIIEKHHRMKADAPAARLYCWRRHQRGVSRRQGLYVRPPRQSGKTAERNRHPRGARRYCRRRTHGAVFGRQRNHRNHP